MIIDYDSFNWTAALIKRHVDDFMLPVGDRRIKITPDFIPSGPFNPELISWYSLSNKITNAVEDEHKIILTGDGEWQSAML